MYMYMSVNLHVPIVTCSYNEMANSNSIEKKDFFETHLNFFVFKNKKLK